MVCSGEAEQLSVYVHRLTEAGQSSTTSTFRKSGLREILDNPLPLLSESGTETECVLLQIGQEATLTEAGMETHVH